MVTWLVSVLSLIPSGPSGWSATSSIILVVVPLGSFPLEEAVWIARKLPGKFPFTIEARVSLWRVTPPLRFYDWDRRQFIADRLASFLADSLGFLKPPRIIALGLSEADAYVSGLNFVFGIALPARGVGVVFSKRLYTPDRELLRARLLKESMHEIGHLLGLGHCPNRRCVMSFSNTVSDVDYKEASFCDDCRFKLLRVARALNIGDER